MPIKFGKKILTDSGAISILVDLGQKRFLHAEICTSITQLLEINIEGLSFDFHT